ncbi:MAG: M56 family metallopeptidase [Terracidiphilus sp.]|jgi:beta-lactamase regulating signal transducer with metallopeptidase domain
MFWTLMAGGVHAALESAGGWLVAFAETAAPVAVAALWQGAAIALVLAVCLGLTSRAKFHIGAAQRFGLWAAAFAVVVVLGFLPWLAHGAAGAIAANAHLGAVAPRARFEFDDRWAFAIAALWLVASLVRVASFAVHSLHLRRLWNSASPIAADAKLRALLTAASPTRRSHSRKIAELCTTRKLDRPSVIGFLAPRILIPEWLFARLTPGELEQVVLHEAEHLRRRDDWTNLLQKLALVLFPLNPALAWIEGRLCREREMACDEGVVRRTQAPRAYAQCLTSLAERGLERRRAHALSLGAFERRPELVRRVYSILARKQALHPMAARALVGLVGCGLLAASVELARCPQMVAFVPAAQTATLETQGTRAGSAPQFGDGDRAFVEPTVARGDSGFRSLNTKAILPAGHGVAPVAPASLRRGVTPSVEPDGARQRLVASTGEMPREVLLRAEMPDADAGAAGQDANSGFAGEPHYVVPTAWEEVRTSRRHGGRFADYDAGATSQPQSADAADQTGSETFTQITVTRLILAVYPISFGPNGSELNGSGPGAKPAHAEDSGRPPTQLPESGWLVFQL